MLKGRTDLIGRGLWDVRLWVLLGLVFLALNLGGNGEPRSPFWFSELLLYGVMFVGLWANRKFSLRKRIAIPRRLAPLAYIGLVWLLGMIFETSLTVNGEGIGGVHPQTGPSFILAQGDYIPIAVVSYFVIRKLRLSFRQAYFFAGGKSMTEGLIFTGALLGVIASPLFFLAPLVIAYYTLAYSSFIALPLLFIDEELLWGSAPPQRKWSIPRLVVLGFVLAFGIRVFWGLVYSPLVNWLFQLPPNLAGLK